MFFFIEWHFSKFCCLHRFIMTKKQLRNRVIKIGSNKPKNSFLIQWYSVNNPIHSTRHDLGQCFVKIQLRLSSLFLSLGLVPSILSFDSIIDVVFFVFEQYRKKEGKKENQEMRECTSKVTLSNVARTWSHSNDRPLTIDRWLRNQLMILTRDPLV